MIISSYKHDLETYKTSSQNLITISNNRMKVRIIIPLKINSLFSLLIAGLMWFPSLLLWLFWILTIVGGFITSFVSLSIVLRIQDESSCSVPLFIFVHVVLIELWTVRINIKLTDSSLVTETFQFLRLLCLNSFSFNYWKLLFIAAENWGCLLFVTMVKIHWWHIRFFFSYFEF